MRLKTLILATAATAALALPARAAVVFSDNFDGETLGLNYTGFANFAVTAGSVDLIGTGFFDFYPGAGRYVDLDGSTPNNDPADGLTTNASFAAGAYTLTFQLGGSARGDTNTVRVTLGDFTQDITLGSAAGLTSQSFSFTTTGGALSFTNLGPSDNIGLILDDVKLATAVPEASTWAMMLIGFAGLGVMSRRRRRLAPA